jgi:hypothetical protein
MRKNQSLINLLALTVCGLLSFTATGYAQEPFSIVLLPDTQYYTDAVRRATYGNVYAAQTAWIAFRESDRNIKFVASLGDMTDQNTTDQWNIVTAAHATLDAAQIPYNATTGNHDIKPREHLRQSGIDTVFSKDYFDDRNGWVGYGAGLEGNNQNNYFLFQSDSHKFLVLSLEYAPRKDAVVWANEIVKKFPDRQVIVITHGYTKPGGNQLVDLSDAANMEGRDPSDLWNEFARRHSNIILILSGHVTGTAHHTRHGLYKATPDSPGNPVHEILSDFQSEPAGGGTGHTFGNGWLRILTFRPDSGVIDVETFNIYSDPEFLERKPEYAITRNKLFPSTEPQENPHRPELYKANTGIYDALPGLTGSALLNPPLPWATTFDYRNTLPATAEIKFKDRLANRTPSGEHINAKIATAPGGNHVVVWEDDTDGNGHGQIHARVFTPDGALVLKKSDGTTRFSDLAVNSNPDGDQHDPDVAMADNGNFVVVWEDDSNNQNGFFEIMVRGFKADGTQLFSDRVVNTTSEGQQRNPAIAMDGAGNFAVVWEDDNDGNGDYQIYGRTYLANGTARNATSFVVNSTTAVGNQRGPAIGMDSSARFVVAWEDGRDRDGKYDIFARGFSATGGNRLIETPVHPGTTGNHRSPAVAVEDDGDFIIAWEDDNDNNGFYQILARGWTASGGASIDAFTVNSDADGQQSQPAVAVDASGNFIVTWQDDDDIDNMHDIMARSFSTARTPVQRKADFIVNADQSHDQLLPSVALDTKGRAFFAWQDNADDEDATYTILTTHAVY